MSRVTPPQQSDSDGPQLYLVLPHQDEDIYRLGYLPDGQRVVIGSWSGAVRVWNVESGEQEGTSMKHEGEISGLAVARDGTKIISSGLSGGIKVWDVKSHELVKEWTHPVVAISPDNRLVAVGRKKVAIYSTEGRHIDSVKIGGFIWSMRFSPDGNKLTCRTNLNFGIRVYYDVNSGTLIAGLRPLITLPVRVDVSASTGGVGQILGTG